jgi:hypothetical protein
MNRKVFLGAGSGVLLAGVVAVLVARANPMPAPDVRNIYGEGDQDVTAVMPVPSGLTCGAWGVTDLKVQTSEPPTGFTGLCLMDRPYGATLPTICFSPPGAKYNDSFGNALVSTTTCAAPTSQVAQPSSQIHVDQGTGKVSRQSAAGYRRAVTCAPHMNPPPQCAGGTTNGGCPCFTTPVSNSCCTPFQTEMASSDGQTAQVAAYFSKSLSSGDNE